MAFALTWDKTGERYYETGIKQCVLYPQKTDGTYDTGVAWNGITGVDESPSGAEATDLWADDIKYLSIRSTEEFGFTIKAYTYPDEFGICDGTQSPVNGLKIFQQARRGFGLCYRTTKGNDAAYNDYGYILHLIYGATVNPSSRSYSTINDSPEAIEFSWEASTTPIAVDGYRNTAVITLDSTIVPAAKMAQIENILYGVEGGSSPRLPLPSEIISILQGAVTPAVLTGLTMANVTLTPSFDDEIIAYSGTTTSASGTITATAASGVAIAITVNGDTVANEGTASYDEGANTVVITASKDGSTPTTYTITVVRS